MKILVLSSVHGNYNDPIHRGFFQAVPRSAAVAFYGPTERGGPSFDPKRSLSSVVAEVKADLVLVNMKKRVKDWLKPNEMADLSATSVKTAVVEVDFCYERKDQSWYTACHFDVLFLRAKSDVLASRCPQTHWLPFSVKPEWICTPDRNDRRPHDIVFAGTRHPQTYPGRNTALVVLKDRVVQPKARIQGEAYMHWWQRGRLGLTCSSIWRYENAKHVIIPGAGALLLTDGSPGISELLPSAAYTIYKTDGSDLNEVVRGALADPKLLERRREGAEHVAKHHTHAVRWSQLFTRMEAVRRG